MILLLVAMVTAGVAAARGMWSPCGLSMLSSLNPVSESARGHRFWVTALWYVSGAAVGGVLLGDGLALVAFGVGRLQLSESTTWGLVLTAAVIVIASDTALFGRSLPDHPRQVDERWLVKYRRWIYAGGYGLQIGAGFATYIMTAAVYLVAALAVLTASPPSVWMIGVVFGTVRGLTVAVAARARTPELLRRMHQRLDRVAGASLWVAIAIEAAVAAVSGWVLAGPLLGAAMLAATACLAAVRPLRGRALRGRARKIVLRA